MWKSNACQAGIMCVYELFSALCSRALTAITHSAIHRRRVKSEDDEFIFIGSKVVFRTFECVCVCVCHGSIRQPIISSSRYYTTHGARFGCRFQISSGNIMIQGGGYICVVVRTKSKRWRMLRMRLMTFFHETRNKKMTWVELSNISTFLSTFFF